MLLVEEMLRRKLVDRGGKAPGVLPGKEAGDQFGPVPVGIGGVAAPLAGPCVPAAGLPVAAAVICAWMAARSAGVRIRPSKTLGTVDSGCGWH